MQGKLKAIELYFNNVQEKHQMKTKIFNKFKK